MTVHCMGAGIAHSQAEVIYGELGKSVRITGESRAQLAADLKAQYEQGASIRELTRTTGRSYGFIHQVLSETQVPLRGRGHPWHRRTTPQSD